MSEDSGLVFAFCLDGKGGGREVSFENVRQWTPEDGTLWLHLDYTGEAAGAILRHSAK